MATRRQWRSLSSSTVIPRHAARIRALCRPRVKATKPRLSRQTFWKFESAPLAKRGALFHLILLVVSVLGLIGMLLVPGLDGVLFDALHAVAENPSDDLFSLLLGLAVGGVEV